MKILLLGATGMLGHVVYQQLKSLKNTELHNLVFRTKLDSYSRICNVLNKEELEAIVREIRPSCVVNCIGALKKQSVEHPDEAIYLNAVLPHQLASWCSAWKGRLVHVSTDCVFSGNRGAYAEGDFRDADDVYGRSKALGEVSYGNHITLRTSIIGPELKEKGEGLMHWFFNQSGKTPGYETVFWSGVTTLELSKAILWAIDTELSGLFQVTNGHRINKYELLKEIKNTFGLNQITLEKKVAYQSDKSLIPSIRHDFKVQDYSSMLLELKAFMEAQTDKYHYYRS